MLIKRVKGVNVVLHIWFIFNGASSITFSLFPSFFFRLSEEGMAISWYAHSFTRPHGRLWVREGEEEKPERKIIYWKNSRVPITLTWREKMVKNLSCDNRTSLKRRGMEDTRAGEGWNQLIGAEIISKLHGYRGISCNYRHARGEFVWRWTASEFQFICDKAEGSERQIMPTKNYKLTVCGNLFSIFAVEALRCNKCKNSDLPGIEGFHAIMETHVQR